MGAKKKLKMVMIDKGINQIDLAEMTGRKIGTLRNMLFRDNMAYTTVEELADALGCDVILRDRKTGKLYR